ncbi:MAG: glycosyltransferase family 4 protein [Pyrinomonadaceae bacterium]|nr:glycosyltransferase family 4 protein [Pyrinomonadaceae bacterium]MCX7639930.1 glycosyltransferase family 4 protein [Pyrinomonadaceae bacterium]MDW8304102.1 glycosyltransferase family 4 protein [Acidobacteriota bacterium]
MRVIQILDSLNRGGAEIQVLELCRNASNFGIEAIFVTFGDGELKEDFLRLDIPVVTLRRRMPFDLNLALKLRKVIKLYKAEIIHCYQPVEALHAYVATLGSKVKRVLSFQGFIQDEKNRITAKFLTSRMHANIVVSEGLRKWLKESAGLSADNFYLVYNGADEKRVTSNEKRLRTELNLREELLFGMIANFYRDPRKDQMTVCRSLPKIFFEVPNARCVFIGKVEAGAERKYQACIDFCRDRQIADKVYFLGPRKDIPEILSSLDVFVFSSLHEGLPLAVSEAMLAGLPVVLSDIPPLLEISQNGEYAVVFETQNEEDLANKLIELLKNEQKRKLLGKKAKDFALKNFSINAHLKKLKELYSSLLSS